MMTTDNETAKLRALITGYEVAQCVYAAAYPFANSRVGTVGVGLFGP